MEALAAQVLVQARNLRGLCAEFAHGARRDAFLALVDADMEALLGSRLRITLIVLDDSRAPVLASVHGASGLAAIDNSAQTALAIVASGHPNVPDATAPGAHVQHLPLSSDASSLGISSINVVLSAPAVWTSPVLYGHLLKTTDVVVVCGPMGTQDQVLLEGLEGLAAVCDYGLHWRSGTPGDAPAATNAQVLFRHWQVLDAACDGEPFVRAIASHAGAESRQKMLVSAAWLRLAQSADLLHKTIQTEIAALKFRNGDIPRMRYAEDVSTGDLKEQTEPLRAMLEQWSLARRDEILRGNEDGVLPFDPRLLASRLTIDNLILRQEHSAAESKYPILKAKIFQSMVSHRYTLVPDPAAIDGIRSQLLTALDVQIRKDVDLFNLQSGELVDQLRRSAEVYPAFADALKAMRLPVLQRARFDRLLNGITLDADIEDSHSRLGLFKRLAEGRMFASMAFSFVTMSAGVFVLFGEPSIKRGLMKFSGVIVIVMVLYFVFSMLVKSEEEKKSLEEKLEKMREQVNQSVMRPLTKAEQGIVKTYQAFVEDVKACVAAAIEGVLKQKSLAKARMAEFRKSEDELVKGFLARRQQAAGVLAQKLPQFVLGLEKARQAGERPVAAAAAVGSLPLRAAALARPLATAPAAQAPAAQAATAVPQVQAPAPTVAPPSSAPRVSAAPVSAPPVRSAAMERVAALARARQQLTAPVSVAPKAPDSAEGAA